MAIDAPSHEDNSDDSRSGDDSQDVLSASAISRSGDEENGESESDSLSSDDDAEDGDVQGQISKVSFSKLARAQASIGESGSRKRKLGEETSEEQKSKLAAMRERLQELRAAVKVSGRSETAKAMAKTKLVPKERRQRADHAFFGDSDGDDDIEDGGNDDDAAMDHSDDSDSDAEGSDKDPRSRQKRSSKHAPTAMPANRAVGRYREVVDVPKIKSRDPRFDVTSGYLDRNVVQSRYSFLNDYHTDELTSLKKALKDPKAKLTVDQREKLQRKVVSLESKIAAAKARAREDKVKREHKQQEREAVAQGKKPFYLKNSDVKKKALVDRFEGMKSRQKDKAIQRRRKKLAAKERRDMPMARRG